MLLPALLAAACISLGCATAGSAARDQAVAPGGDAAAQERDQASLASARASVAPLPDPKSATRVSLGQLLAYAERHSPLMGVARGHAAARRAEKEAASPLLQENPEVGLAAGGRTRGGATFFELEASVEQRIEIAGERGLRLEAAEAERKLSDAELVEARWEVHRQVHARFAEALVARLQLEAADRLVAFAEELRTVASKRAEVGETAPFTELVAEADVAQARQARVAARQRRDAILVELAEIVGWPHLELPPLDGVLPPVRKAPSSSVLLATALRHHPGQRSRALAVEAAAARVRLEEREAWPEPAVGVAYAREGEEDGAAHVWVGTLSVPIPLWNRNQAGRARARGALDVQRAERDAAASHLRARVVRAAAEVDAAAERVTIHGSAIVPAFDRHLKLIQRAYELGELDIHRVSQIRERLLASQVEALAALADYHRAVAALEALLGTEVWAAMPGPTTGSGP